MLWCLGQSVQKNRKRERERDVFSRPKKHARCCRILVIFHHVVTGITDCPRIHKVFLVWTKIPNNFAVDDWPIHPIFKLDTALLGLSNFILNDDGIVHTAPVLFRHGWWLTPNEDTCKRENTNDTRSAHSARLMQISRDSHALSFGPLHTENTLMLTPHCCPMADHVQKLNGGVEP